VDAPAGDGQVLRRIGDTECRHLPRSDLASFVGG
jgi:hypothetical protein